MGMSGKSKDKPTRALTVLKPPEREAQPPAAGTKKPSDVGELFLAELRARREHLREWIEMLTLEADSETVLRQAPIRISPRVCRGRRRQDHVA